jgi:hypothetical protein
VASAIGTNPSEATKAVTSTGLTRSSAPCRIADSTSGSVSNLRRIEPIKTNPFRTATPETAMKPTDEWLALYKKYHRPIMDFQVQKGVTISTTLYAAADHSPGQPWDFCIINISAPDGEGPKLGLTRAEVIRKLFSNIEDYVKGERERWALTVNHWDETLIEIDVNREPLSVYYPLDAPPKK